MLIALCKNLEIEFDNKMLSWPTGIRKTDGIWAKHWYKQVECTNGFKPYIEINRKIPIKYQRLNDICMEYYDFLYQKRISSS